MSIVYKNGILQFEDERQKEPEKKPEQVGDPRRKDWSYGICLPGVGDYSGEKKTMREWVPLVARGVVRSSLPPDDNLYTESEFFDRLEVLPVEQLC